jgi:hypothetical protein
MRVPALLFLMVLIAGVAAADEAIPSSATVIAHYPLLSDGVDATGNNGDLVINNAPFTEGGIYCNGIYYLLPGGYWIWTPNIPALNFDSFAVSLQFKIDQYPSESDYARPIIVCGFDYRYLGAKVFADSTISFLFNNSNDVHSDQKIALHVWHELIVTYDHASLQGKLYLDGSYICGENFEIEHGTDPNLGPLNPANASAFLGWIRELVVYDTAFDPLPVRRSTWGRVKSSYGRP